MNEANELSPSIESPMMLSIISATRCVFLDLGFQKTKVCASRFRKKEVLVPRRHSSYGTHGIVFGGTRRGKRLFLYFFPIFNAGTLPTPTQYKTYPTFYTSRISFLANYLKNLLPAAHFLSRMALFWPTFTVLHPAHFPFREEPHGDATRPSS